MGGPPKKRNSEKEDEVKKGGGGEEGRGKRKKGEEKKDRAFRGERVSSFSRKKYSRWSPLIKIFVSDPLVSPNGSEPLPPDFETHGTPHPLPSINLDRKPTGQSDPYSKLMTPIPPKDLEA